MRICLKTLILILSVLISAFQLIAQDIAYNGSFVYSYPIELPPGTNGIGPEISLIYNSMMGNGIIGMGWSISGISVITRNPSYDITFTDEDHYMFNGQELVKAGDDYYHTKKESFLRIEAFNLNSPYSYWIVTHKNGLKMYYGYQSSEHGLNNHGHIEAVGKVGRARLWALSKVEDVHGNYYIIEYDEESDSETGDYYPERIIYTIGNGLSHYRTIEFKYRDRNDKEPIYIPAKVQINSLLEWIIVKVDGELLRKYHLEYEESKSTGRSRLISITEYGSDGSKKPSHIFEWTDIEGNQILSVAFEDTLDAWSDNDQFSSMDLNGDGRSDIVKFYNNGGTATAKIWISEGSGFSSTPVVHSFSSWDGTNKYFPMDVNGDGKSDIVEVYGITDKGLAHFRVWLFDGNNFFFSSETYHDYLWDHWYVGMNFRPMDVNGDGMDDFVVQINADSIPKCPCPPNEWVRVYLSDGTKLDDIYDSKDIISNLKIGTIISDKSYPIDINRDGMDDLILIQHETVKDEAWVKIFLSNGNELTSGNSYYAGSWDDRFYVMDVNGDGMGDYLRLYNNNGTTKGTLALFTGTEFIIIEVGEFGQWSDSDRYYRMDINGDGRCDLVKVERVGNTRFAVSKVWVSNGDSFIKDTDNYFGDWHLYNPDRRMPMDLDGDGKADIVDVYNSAGTTKAKTYMLYGGFPDLLSTIHNGSGGTIAVKYASAAQLEGAIDSSDSIYPFIVDKRSRHLVIKITFMDGLGKSESRIYEYDRGMLYMGKPWERKELGFSCIRSIDTVKGDYEETMYLQDDPILSGFIKKKAIYDAYDTKYRENRYIYAVDDVYPDSPEIKFIRMKDKYTYDYEGSDTADEYRIQYVEYDDHGNIMEIWDHGLMEDPFDDTSIKFNYSYNADEYITVPSSIRKYSYDLDDSFGLEFEVRYYYDGIEEPGYVEKGLMTKKEKENGGGLGVITYGYDIVETYGYDEYGSRIWIKDGRINCGEYGGYTNQIEYDSLYKTFVVTETNALGYIKRTNYNDLLFQKSIEDINGQIWETNYDAFGRITARISPGDNSFSPTKRITYIDAVLNDERDIVFPKCIKTESKESEGEYIEVYSYFDGFGRLIQEKKESGETGYWMTFDYYYDEKGRQWKTSMPYITLNSDYTERDSRVPCYYEEYDVLGRVLRAYNTDGTFREYIYDKRLVTYIDENRHVKTSEIDGRRTLNKSYTGLYPNHQLYTTVITKEARNGKRIIDENGYMIETELDNLGRKIRYRDPDMGEWYYTYDSNGNVIQQRDAKDQIIYFKYDKLNRLTSKEYPSGSPTLFYYDQDGHGYSLGRLTHITYSGGSESYSYDERGRIISETRTIKGKTRNLFTEYDSMDRIIKRIYPDGEEIIYVYDNGGSLYSIGSAFTENYNNYVREILYTPTGKVRYISYGNGITTTYDYYDTEWEFDNSAGSRFSYRLRKIITNPEDILHMYYEYDRADNVTLKKNLHNYYYTEIYNYDELNRLRGASSYLYGYNSYEYDSVNNLIEKDGRSFSYLDERPHAIKDDEFFHYTYDANGNTVLRSDGKIFSYDYENRLVSISDGRMYNYDAEGNRIFKYEDGVTTLYFFPQYEEEYYEEKTKPNRLKYYFANGQRIARWSDKDGLLFFHFDHLGSSVRITDSDGELRGVFKYAPYGSELVGYVLDKIPENIYIENEIIDNKEEISARVMLKVGPSVLIEKDASVKLIAGTRVILEPGLKVQSGAVVRIEINPTLNEPEDKIEIKYLFTGKEKDKSGLYYYGSRYYGPEIASFISPDPVLDGLNRYAYCKNNPVRYIDPMGYSPIPVEPGAWANPPSYSPVPGLPSAPPNSSNIDLINDGQINGTESANSVYEEISDQEVTLPFTFNFDSFYSSEIGVEVTTVKIIEINDNLFNGFFGRYSVYGFMATNTKTGSGSNVYGVDFDYSFNANFSRSMRIGNKTIAVVMGEDTQGIAVKNDDVLLDKSQKLFIGKANGDLKVVYENAYAFTNKKSQNDITYGSTSEIIITPGNISLITGVIILKGVSSIFSSSGFAPIYP